MSKAKGKPMMVYVVFDCDGDILTTQFTRTSADLDAKLGHPLYAPYRVVRFVEVVKKRKPRPQPGGGMETR